VRWCALDSPTAAAWLQAIASVAAIVAAFLVGKWQANTALTAVTEAHRLEERSRRRSILAIAEAGAEHARIIDSALLSTDNRLQASVALVDVYDKSIVDGMVRALTDVPVHEVGSRDAVIALLALRDQFVFLGIAMEKYLAGASRDPELQKAIEACDPGTARRNFIASAEQVLAKNARRRLATIAELYASLKESMG
jgi:hypothetical protein